MEGEKLYSRLINTSLALKSARPVGATQVKSHCLLEILSGCQTYHHRDLNASINIRNYALGMLDERHAIKVDKTRVGITRSYACGDSANGAVTKYGYILDTNKICGSIGAFSTWPILVFLIHK